MGAIAEILLDHTEYRRQIFQLAKSDIRKTYKDTALGWVWALVKPLVRVAVYYFAFTFGLRVGKPVNGYPYYVWLTLGMIPWFYMMSAILGGANSIRKYRFLVTKIRFPISVIPTVVTLSDFLVHLLVMALILVIFALTGVKPDIYWLQILFYELLMFLFFGAWSLFAGVLSALIPDFYHLVRSSTMILLWFSGVLYRVNTIDNRILRTIVSYNPVTIFVEGLRNAVINKQWFWTNWRPMAYLGIEYLILVVAGVVLYKKYKNYLPDVL